jgi:hypothetical protein
MTAGRSSPPLSMACYKCSLRLLLLLCRSALHFAAGNDALSTLEVLLQCGASIAQRDRRLRSVLDYAPEGSEARRHLCERLRALEEVADQRQADLLADLEGGGGGAAAAGAAAAASSKAGASAVGAAGSAISKVRAGGKREGGGGRGDVLVGWIRVSSGKGLGRGVREAEGPVS